MTEPETTINQIRLLIPKKWVSELDTIARTKYMSRLALIRSYIRERMDKDIQILNDNLEEIEKFKDVMTFVENRSKTTKIPDFKCCEDSY